MFSLTFQKWDLPQAGGRQRLSGGSQTPPNPNLGSLPSTKKKEKKPNRSGETKCAIFLNKELNVCVERTTALNKHFLQFPIPRDEICIGSDTGCLIKTKSLHPTPYTTEDQQDVIKTINFAPGDKSELPFAFAVQHS